MAALFAQPQAIQQPYQQQQVQVQQRQPSLASGGNAQPGSTAGRPMQMQYGHEVAYLGPGSAPASESAGPIMAESHNAEQVNAGRARVESDTVVQNGVPSTMRKPARPSISIPEPQDASVIPQQSSPATAWETFTGSNHPQLLPAVSPTDHKHLFNAYIFDYLFKQGYQEAARAFLLNAPDTPIKRTAVPQASDSTTDDSNPKSAVDSNAGRTQKGANGRADPTDLHTGNAESSTAHLRAASLSSRQMQSALGAFDAEDGSVALNSGDNSERGQRRHVRSRTGPAPSTADSDKSDATQSSMSSSRFGGTSKDSNTTNATSIMGVDGNSQRKKENDMSSENPRSSATPPLDAPSLYSPPSASTAKTPRMTTNSSTSLNDALPEPDVQITAPKGFLFEWWSVFWDIFRARGEKGGSPAAKAYYQVAQTPVS